MVRFANRVGGMLGWVGGGLRLVVACAAIWLAAASLAQADSLTPDQQAALEARIESFEAALKGLDMAEVLAVVPPRVIEHIAEKYGVTVDEVVAAGQEQLQASFSAAELLSVDMTYDTDGLVVLSDDLAYLMLPTTMQIDLGVDSGGVIDANGATLGLLEEGTWYLVSLDNAEQIETMRLLYPGLAEVDFAAATGEGGNP